MKGIGLVAQRAENLWASTAVKVEAGDTVNCQRRRSGEEGRAQQ